MPRAVRFDEYGGVEVLEVRDVARPEPGPEQVLVAVRAAGINPSEGKIREGVVRAIFPATFPSGQGSDFAGVVPTVIKIPVPTATTESAARRARESFTFGERRTRAPASAMSRRRCRPTSTP